MSYATFVAQFPEFVQVPQANVQPVLDAALLELDPNIWGLMIDQAQAYTAAHKLALSPMGNNARLVTKDGSTTYEKQLRRMINMRTQSNRVL